MAKRLPIDVRLQSLGQLVLRAKRFYDIWWFYEGQKPAPEDHQYDERISFFL